MKLYKKLFPGDCIKCCFGITIPDIPVSSRSCTEVFVAHLSDFRAEYEKLVRFIDYNEELRASSFMSEDDRKSYIISHGILKLILSHKFGSEPVALNITRDKNGKPWIPGNRIFFSISHTAEVLALAISSSAIIGTDIEKITVRKDLISLTGLVFSPDEIDFLAKDDSGDRFFLLWTRKEAFLKSIGSGIIDSLSGVEVHRDTNIIDPEIFSNINIGKDLLSDQYIYSSKLAGHFLSISTPVQTEITLYGLTSEDLRLFYPHY